MDVTGGRGQPRELRDQPWVMGLIGGTIVVPLIVIISLLIVPRTHMTLEAKCSPLAEPKLKHDGTLWRGMVPVEVISHRNGYGASVLSHYSEVFNSAHGSWSHDYLAELNFTKAHCLCPGCTGTEDGKCPCQPRTAGCDFPPPEYPCYMYTSVPEISNLVYTINVGHVRFKKNLVHDYKNWWIAMIFFIVLLCIGVFLAVVLYLPRLLQRDDGNGAYKPLDAYD